MSHANPLPLFHIVGFTGHRQLADPAGTEQALRSTLASLRSETAGEWLALSSIAEGADLLFARSARSLGLGWETILPLPPADFRTDFSNDAWREVEALLSQAEQVRVIGQRYARDDAYLDCGMETVNNSDLLLAVWDGEPSRGRGGTAEIVAYARALNRPIVIIDPATLAVRRENFDRLKTGDHHLARFNALPDPVSDAPPADPVAPASVAPTRDPSRRIVEIFQRRADHAATHGAPHFRRLITITVGLHVLATALAATALAWDLHFAVLPWGKLLCLVGALAVALVVRHHHHRLDWMRCRLAAEIARSALATWGLPRATRLFDDFDWSGLEPLRRSLDVLQRRAAQAYPENLDAFKQRYIAERIDGQHAYFSRQLARAEPLLARLRFGFGVSSILAIVFTAAYALHSLTHDMQVPAWVRDGLFEFAPVVLPVLAAGFISLVSINDLHRRVARYKEMRTRLEAARKEAAFSQTWGSLERVVSKTERALLQEVFEWHSITSFSESH